MKSQCPDKNLEECPFMKGACNVVVLKDQLQLVSQASKRHGGTGNKNGKVYLVSFGLC
jgi:hypothetical protein